MEYTFSLAGFEEQQLKLVIGTFRKCPKILVEGQPAPLNPYGNVEIRRADGTQALRNTTGGLYLEDASAAKNARDAHGQSYFASYPDLFSILQPDQRQVETKPKSRRGLTRKRKALVILSVVVGLIIYILVITEGGRTAKAICTRVEPYGPVDCARETSMFGIIPLNQMEIRNVKSVIWDEEKWYEDGNWFYVYSIELGTDQGRFPFSPSHGSGGPKLEALESLQSFVYGTAPGTLIVTDSGALTWVTLELQGLSALLIIILLVFGAIMTSWEEIKTRFHRDQTL